MVKSKNYYHAVAVMFGYTIGVGMFSLPYLFHRAGVAAFFVFVPLIALIQYSLNLIYANLIVATKNFHILPGYAEIYFGRRGKIFVFVAKIIGDFGALTAYTIATGLFVHELFSPLWGGSEFFYGTLVFFVEALVLLWGLKMMARVEFFMSSLLLFAIFFIVFKGIGFVDLNNYHPLIDWKFFLLPYGAILFAFDGSGSIPIISKILNKDAREIKSVIRVNMLLVSLVVVLFVLVVIGATGQGVTPDSLVGLNRTVDGSVTKIALFIGIMGMVTSFLGVAESARSTLEWDFKMNKNISWLIAIGVPYLFFLLGLKSLAAIISFVGAVSGGLCGLVLIMIYRKMKANKEELSMFKYQLSDVIIFILSVVFTLGMIYEVYFFIFGNHI